jgi:hypothetical protein
MEMVWKPARVGAGRRLLAANPNQYLLHGVRRGERIVICARVSHRGNRAHLDQQIAMLRQAATDQRAIVAAVIAHVGRGAEPAWVGRAVAAAKRQRADKLFSESTDRWVRHPGYHPNENPTAQPRMSEFEELLMFADGIPLATLLPPDAPFEEVRWHQQLRGRMFDQTVLRETVVRARKRVTRTG